MQPVMDPEFWRGRIVDVAREGKDQRCAVFRSSGDQWDAVCKKHKQILAAWVKDDWSILDVGCAYGRLLELMPPSWCGRYLGIDVSTDFVEMARTAYPEREFKDGDVRNLVCVPPYDLAILVSIRGMVLRECGLSVWREVEEAVRRNARRTLYLEYDPKGEGKFVCTGL